jgi:hypothetical protein
MEPNPFLVGTSVLFVIPTTLAAYHRQWHLYAPFLFMSIISSVYHATKYRPLLYLDYPGCYWVLITLGVETYKIGQFHFFMLFSGMCGFLFWGGYLLERFVHSPEIVEKTFSHMLMHMIVVGSSIATSYLASEHKVIVNENKLDWEL